LTTNRPRPCPPKSKEIFATSVEGSLVYLIAAHDADWAEQIARSLSLPTGIVSTRLATQEEAEAFNRWAGAHRSRELLPIAVAAQESLHSSLMHDPKASSRN